MKPLFDHFGYLAPLYEFFIRPKDPAKIWSLIGIPKDGIVLDAGGGTGRVAQYLRSKAAQIVVADESFNMLRETQNKDGLQGIQSYTEDLPFQNDTFDSIIMVDALHHVSDQRKTTEELWRILKPGGRLIIEEPNIHSLSVKFIALAEKLALMRSHFLAPQQIVSLFQGKPSTVRFEVEDSSTWIIVENSSNCRKKRCFFRQFDEFIIPLWRKFALEGKQANNPQSLRYLLLRFIEIRYLPLHHFNLRPQPVFTFFKEYIPFFHSYYVG